MNPAAWTAILAFASGVSGLLYQLTDYHELTTPVNVGVLLSLVVTLFSALFARTPGPVVTALRPIFGAGQQERRDHERRE